VAHTELDLARPKQNKGAKGFTAEERGAFDRMIEAGFVDTLREFETGDGHYSWWSNWGGARARNVGWRVDYVMIGGALRPRLESATIYADVMGSDHCPVGIVLE
jgi:exodeoxyribonuclease III